MADREQGDIIVAGTGPAGLIAALGLAHKGFSVTLAGPPARRDDGRTTALMMPALNYLQSIGLPPFPVGEAAPLASMRIVDATRRLIRSAPVTFRAAEIGEAAFGMNIPNKVLNATLEAAVESTPAISWHRSMVARWTLSADGVEAELSDGSELSARLAVAADGRGSPAREAAAIAMRTHAYAQSALVVNFGHSRDHGSVSTEFHTETGPFTQVPLPGKRSSLVWVVAPETAAELAALDDAELSWRIEERMQSMFGRVAVEPGRQIYPMSAALPASIAQNRVALVGEAAHVFPPIGAQGLNLGIRDVADLVETAASHAADPGAEDALAAYRSARRPDVLARSAAVNVLYLSLLAEMLPAQFARSAGLGLLAGIAPLRGFFMREGMQPGSGFARMASSLRKEIRR